MDYFSAIQYKALLSVMQPDEKATLRAIFRWYSKTFHTPLSLVEELPVEDVLQAYFEESFEQMGDEKRRDLLKKLTSSPDELEERAAREEQEDEEYIRQIREQEAQNGHLPHPEEFSIEFEEG